MNHEGDRESMHLRAVFKRQVYSPFVCSLLCLIHPRLCCFGVNPIGVVCCNRV
jgi:hypothetical protein